MLIIASILGLFAIGSVFIVNKMSNDSNTAGQAYNEKHNAVAKNYFQVVDVEMNSTKFAELFTADAHFSIWNFPTSIGHEQIKNGCQGMFSMVTSLEHKSSRLMSVDEDKFIVEGTVTYKLASGRTLDPISLCSIYELLPGTTLIKNYKAYLDLNPLFLALGNDLTEDENGRPTHVPRVRVTTASE